MIRHSETVAIQETQNKSLDPLNSMHCTCMGRALDIVASQIYVLMKIVESEAVHTHANTQSY